MAASPDSLREFFAILNSSRKGELSTWDTIYLHLILAINADSDLIKNDELLAENIPSANYQFNIFFSNAFEIDVKKYLGKSEDNEGNDSNLLIVFYVQIMPDDFVMQLHRF